ncbi:MAG: M23 family metallopeptidase [Bacteroidaceae bacterium]|nr:M23 family metallopeptidase [Bacteroidaceae bacterium]
MPKLHKQRTFWKKVRSKYKLSFFNENSLEEVWTFRLSRLGAFIGLSLLLFMTFAAVAFLFAATPLKTLLPGYLKTEARAKIVDNALILDSLERKVNLQEKYINSLRFILSGEINFDSISTTDSLPTFPQQDSLLEQSKASLDFMQKFEEEEKYTLTVLPNTLPTDGFIFYPPVRGTVTQIFNPVIKHFGVDVSVPKNTAVAAVLDGTVISSSYTIETGYIIEIQHSNDFISIYKYNAQLLKTIGEKVIGGEKIALAGNGDGEKNTPLLEFQLWHKGQPLNPLEYITF